MGSPDSVTTTATKVSHGVIMAAAITIAPIKIIVKKIIHRGTCMVAPVVSPLRHVNMVAVENFDEIKKHVT